ncbi:MAG TPA: capsule assembly Wzi family protein [Gemmatimonadaceae bacterium]|nr:capsule assembly Wzi family protein [Gemmatimonadaceae bacterium]
MTFVARCRFVASCQLRVVIIPLFVSLLVGTSRPSSAQSPAGGRSEIFAGSELESYLRYVQTMSKDDSYPWSIRGFSPVEIDALTPGDSLHPWARRYDLARRTHSGFSWDYVRPSLVMTVNTSFPYGGNDGAVWTGKGLTSVFQTGVSARWGPFSAVIAPTGFRAENQSFRLLRNSESGRFRYADGQFPRAIDRPQRFGALPYSRADFGNSTLRVDVVGIGAGISTANQWWGPTDKFPYVLGNNAGGFPHAFFGTSKPANVGIGRVHTRVVYGQLYQSPYSTVTGPSHFESFSVTGTTRFMAGLIGVFQPRGIAGLEIGGSRFFHAASDSNGVSKHNLGLPFQNIFKSRLAKESDSSILGGDRALKENQLASLFLRWAPPGSGFELYAEYGREDHSGDLRDLLLEPDHASAANFGFRRVWGSASRMTAVRGEAFDFSSAAGSRTRGEGQIYLHGVLRQGHTFRGQMLGADVGPGSGNAQSLAVDRFTPRGRLTAFVSRAVSKETITQYQSGQATPRPVDVMNSIGVETLRFIGPVDVLARVVFTANLDRNFTGDRSNGSFVLGLRQNF